jgi:hypothetical protein
VLLVTVVIDGMLVMVVAEVTVHDEGVVTSNGVVVFTPENATIAPVVAVELEVTLKT